jgi:hypothetical protein
MATSANDQLSLDVTLPLPDEGTPEIDLIDTLLDHHKGDYRAAISELLLDADFLRDQLYNASCLMSDGMGRGWRPRYERT